MGSLTLTAGGFRRSESRISSEFGAESEIAGFQILPRHPVTPAAFDGILVIRLAVIRSDLFARFDVAQGHKQNVAVNRARVAVRPARMIDVLRPVAAHRAVNRPLAINAADADDPFDANPAIRFGVSDLFAGVFSDLTALFEGHGGETAFARNRRLPDGEAGRVSVLHPPSFALSVIT